MDRFQALETFIAVAETGAFNGAAQRLGQSPPAVTRIIAQLEARLGVTLFLRTTRQVRLSESGERFLHDARRVLSDLRDAEASVTGSHGRPRGLLRITAPVLFGRYYITPILAEMLDLYPEMRVQALLLDRVVNLAEEGLDIAIRIGVPEDSSLSAIRVGAVRPVVFAAPDYLARHGTPAVPSDLTSHSILQAGNIENAANWPFQKEGDRLTVRVTPRMTVNDNQAVLDLVRAGRGIGRLLSYQVALALDSGAVVPVLEAFAAPSLPIHILHGEGHRTSAKLRVAADLLRDRLRANPTLRRANL
ncbi:MULTISPECIES: LysR family transcriptional regulator [unclassified Hwanghaeella]|jgi:DNA-binding transcriptional LysR family regulator|uniref:LysR family transcriptional regulator n=1 Tax=unclassified Hwanghaeella TaxID=2605944 RepID=UPI000C978B22|nr:LysR family transcriptional regulator [Rhodospirillales bacterium]|tara:strand:- start:17831 stop:18742 length:912 start_codon:yes stop_codon:yes gene_type:complete